MRRIKPEDSAPSIIHQSQSQGDLPRRPETKQRHLSTAMLKRLLSGRKRKTSVDTIVPISRRLSPGGWGQETMPTHFLLGVQTAKSIKPVPQLPESSPMLQSRKVRVKTKAFTRPAKPRSEPSQVPLERVKHLLAQLSLQFSTRPIKAKPAALTLLRRHRDYICRVQADTVSPELMKRVIFLAWKRTYLRRA